MAANNPFGGVIGSPTGATSSTWSFPTATTPGAASAGSGWSASNPVNNQFTNWWWNTNDPGGGMQFWQQGQGMNPYSPYGQFMSGLTGQLYNGYQAALATQPGINFVDFISQQQGALQNAFGLNRFRYGGQIGGRRVL